MDATQEKMSKEKAEAVDVLFPANVYNYDDFCFPIAIAATSPTRL